MSEKASVCLSRAVDDALASYYQSLNGETPVALYEMVILEVEKSLFKNVMHQTKNNQSLAAKMLGINRNTLRSRLAKFDML